MNKASKAAQTVLDLSWDGMLPVDITKMAKRLGMAVDFVHEVTASEDRVIASLQLKNLTTWTITCNANETPKRVRFALAHALAHHILAHGVPGQVIGYDLKSFRSDAGPNDRMANLLACRILVPSKVMMFAINHKDVNTVEKLSELFDVSPVLIKTRLEEEGVVRPSAKKPRP